MKPSPFQYRRVSSVQEAIHLLATNPDSRIIAGGQSLVPMMNLRVAAPDLIIDISRLNDLNSITVSKAWVRIGALVRHREIETSETILKNLPLLRLAVASVAHQAVRNRGTFGGSISHADPAAEFPACAVLLDATMEAISINGPREIAAREFFQGPFTTALRSDELLVAVRVPIASGYHFSFHELSRRQGDFALAGIAARAQIHGSIWNTEWVAFGVGDRPILLSAVQQLFSNRDANSVRDEEIFAAAGKDLETLELEPAIVSFKQILVGELVARAVSDFAKRPF